MVPQTGMDIHLLKALTDMDSIHKIRKKESAIHKNIT